MRFVKMHGLGNDFVMVDDRQQAGLDWPALAQQVCERRFGVGADGLILVQRSAVNDWKMRIFNSDGSEPQMCGNGIRCFAKFVRDEGFETRDSFAVETLAGPIRPTVVGETDGGLMVAVDMGEPRLKPAEIPIIADPGKQQVVEELLQLDDDPLMVTCVSMGNPHCILFVEDLDQMEVAWWGPMIERHERFPEKTNVEFVKVESPELLQMRVWERGAGRTLACGTGACATLVAAHLTGKAGREATVRLEGGDLQIDWREDNHVIMTGPAASVFAGEWLGG